MFKYILILLILVSLNTFGKVFKVGAGREYSAPSRVMALVQDGDTVEIDAGLYDGDTGIWRKNNLLIRGVNGVAHLKAPANLPEKKAIWVVKGNDCIIENIKFTGAKVIDKNGAGIRFEGTNLTVRKCRFINNEDGILTGENLESTIIVEFCEFGYNGYGNGFSHNIYIGKIKKFIFRYNYTHHANSGHCIKSRALNNIIMYNRIMDESEGNSSYLINLPNGGISYIACNLLMQGRFAENSKMIDYGSEGYKNPENNLFIYNNTFVNKRSPGIFVGVAKGAGKVVIENNIFAGYSANSTGALPAFADTSYNFHEPDVEKLYFVDEKHYNYKLTEKSPVIDMGNNDIEIPGEKNFLRIEYKHPADSAHVVLDDKVDIGAYQFPKDNTFINDKSQTKLNVFYYNEALHISAEKQNGNLSIEIYNLQGRLVHKSILGVSSTILDVQSLHYGIYFYIIKNRNKTTKGSFLKY